MPDDIVGSRAAPCAQTTKGCSVLTSDAHRFGCYGLRLAGVDGARRHLAPVPADAPLLRVTQRVVPARERPPEHLGDTTATIHLSDGTGTASVRTDPGGDGFAVDLEVTTPYDDEALLHPMLAGTAAVVNRWLGRDSFHGGAFVFGDAAWVVLGDKGRGKSTTVGYLATHDVPVLSDDLVIEAAGTVLPGPGFVDLRPDAAVALGVGRDVGVLGARARARLDVGAVTGPRPLAGWLTLAWGDELALRPVPLERRLAMLFDHATVRLAPVDPSAYLRHAARPFFELVRPRRWDAMPDVLALLRARLG